MTAWRKKKTKTFRQQTNLPAQFFAHQLVAASERVSPYPGVDFCNHSAFVHGC